MIYHITTWNEYKKALLSGLYITSSLENEGFIHASAQEQVVGTGNLLFRGQPGLVVMVIDTVKLSSEVKLEPVIINGVESKFPHIYGPINMAAVIGVVDFAVNPDGYFDFPQP